MKRWSEEDAARWYAKTGVIRGCNYLPRTAVNSTEMWQAPTFDPVTIDQELGWAAKAGYNSVRIFLQYLVWHDDAEGLKDRIRQFLTIADKHGISTMLIFFCDCAFAGKEPYLGPQDDPIPGVPNGGWVPSPGFSRVTDQSVWPDLERYVKGIVGSFAADERVLIWDLYNEPANSKMEEKSLPLVEATFAWAREMNPMQPLTTGTWFDYEKPLQKRFVELSDIVSFHGYTDVAEMTRIIKLLQAQGRPILCTEWLMRQKGNTFEEILPVFAENKVGWYHWGLVTGRTQTGYQWESKPGDPMPAIWQHDMMHADGTPFDPREIELVGSFEFKK
jgi:hypothetical protein